MEWKSGFQAEFPLMHFACSQLNFRWQKLYKIKYKSNPKFLKFIVFGGHLLKQVLAAGF